MVTVIAGFCILFTGRYPRPLFDFTSGVLRWSWRVSYYAANGGLGTDQYPPFTLGLALGYPATLDIANPATPSRGLVLVKWWLLAIPHYLIIGLSSATGGAGTPPVNASRSVGTGGLFGLPVVITAIVLLVTGKYPPQLFAADRRGQPVDLPGDRLRRPDDRPGPTVPPRPRRDRTRPAAPVANGRPGDPAGPGSSGHPDRGVTPEPGLMAGKTVLITGGTGGIGKATAIALATLGAASASPAAMTPAHGPPRSTSAGKPETRR